MPIPISRLWWWLWAAEGWTVPTSEPTATVVAIRPETSVRLNMTISLVWLTEAIHPPLDRLSRRPGKRFEDFLIFLAEGAAGIFAAPAMRPNGPRMQRTPGGCPLLRGRTGPMVNY